MTNIGQARSHNEDAIDICEERAFAILADGMGGYHAGEVASQMSVEIVQHFLHKFETSWLPLDLHRKHYSPPYGLDEAVTDANTKVLS